MNILFITRFYSPHIGGVEKHAEEVATSLAKSGHSVTVITSRYASNLKRNERVGNVNVVRLKFAKIKYLGLLSLWKSVWNLREIIKNAEIIHIHDVFIWFLPFVFLYPNKKVFLTMHGWEGVWPIPFKNIFLKRVASLLCNKTILVGKYIQKYYGVKADKIIYGGVRSRTTRIYKKSKGSIVYVGRLEEDTGILSFLSGLENKWHKDVIFVGDGGLRKVCSRLGRVVGFANAEKYMKNAEYVVCSGYLTYIQAKYFNCKTITFYNNPLKKDYWEEIKQVKKFPTWEEITNQYLELWKN